MYSFLDNGVYCSIKIGDIKYNNLKIWQVVYSKCDKNKINVMFNFPETKNTYAQLLRKIIFLLVLQLITNL